MDFRVWEPTFLEICSDFGFNPDGDEQSIRMLEAVTMNSDLDDEDALIPLIKDTVTVFGPADCLESDLRSIHPEGTLIAAGSGCARMTALGFKPDILVTDLDGDIEPQVEASSSGCVTLILAHADNSDKVSRYAHLFKGKVVLTTQGRPRGNVLSFGGFTDGDRSVCLARHFGARRIILLGFDFENPASKPGTDPLVKARKLKWAERIINPGSPDIIMPEHRYSDSIRGA